MPPFVELAILSSQDPNFTMEACIPRGWCTTPEPSKRRLTSAHISKSTSG